MSRVRQSRLAWCASLLVVGTCMDQSASKTVLAAEAKAPRQPAAVLETFAKPDGQAYFALILKPNVAPPKAQPHDVVVMFDTSASQIGAYRDKALGALRALLARLDANDRVALLAVDVNTVRLTPSLIQPTEAALNQALSALEARVPLGSTDMNEALHAAVGVFLDFKDSRRPRSVVYIGDGFSTANPVMPAALERTVRQLKDARIAFTSYAIGPRVDVQLLGALSNHSGGMIVPDDDRSFEDLGAELATMARSAVIWPTTSKLPVAIKEAYPRQMPPLRFDRDSVMIGTIDSAAIQTRQPLVIETQAELFGKKMTLRWQAMPDASSPDNAYLAKVVELAARTNGVVLSTVGSAGLNVVRRMVNYGAQQLARLGERALIVGRTDEAAQLANAAEELSPVNAEATMVRTAAARLRQRSDNDLRLARQDSRPAAEDLPPGDDLPPAATRGEAADGELIDEIERQNRVMVGFLEAEVKNELNQANATMNVDPVGTLDRLKLLLDKVQRTAEIGPEVRAQLAGKIEGTLRATNRMVTVKAEKELQQQQVLAENEARERINRQLFLQQEKVDQLMQRFNALMDEERYRDAEALADIAEEIEPGRPGLRGAELTSRMVGWTADMNQIRDMRWKGFVDATMQIELSHVPTADEPPIIYPDPETWQLLTERRKKYKAVDLTQHGPNETRILQALDEKTDIDFAETPLQDAIEYLENKHEIEIELDQKALSDLGINSDQAITRSLSGITLRSALKLILGEMELTYLIRNEVLMITSQTEAETMLSTRVYPVADLVIPVPSSMMGRGSFSVPDDAAIGEPAFDLQPGAGGFRAFAVSDDLNLTKKAKDAKRPAGAARQKAAAARAVPPAGAKGKAAQSIQQPQANDNGPKAPAAEQQAPNDQAPNDQAPGEQAPDKQAPDKAEQGRRAGRRAAKAEPIQVEFNEGDDVEAVWNDYFAAHKDDQAPSEASVRQTVDQLMNARKFDHAIACMYSALRHQQGQRWMYESLSLALQADGRTPDEIERVLLSVLDFASNPLEVMYLAQYMARSGLNKRALQLFQQVSQVWPFAPAPYIAGLELAQKLDDLEGIEWATLGILSQPWPHQQLHIWDRGRNSAAALLERLRRENRKEEADAYKKKIDEALVRDLVVVVSWNGEADVDLLVEEPAGSVCSFRIPRTLSGGIMLGDTVSRSKKDERKAESVQEAYVCPKGFNGDYRVLLRRVWGKVTANKVTVDVYWHYGAKNERTQRKQIDLSGDEAVCVVTLDDGRRTEPLEQAQLANAVANQVAMQFLWHALQAQQPNAAPNQLAVNRQINAQIDPGVLGSMSRSRAKLPGGPAGLNRVNPFLIRGAMGYMPLISTLPQGAQLLPMTTAVVSADRRYVRVSPFPFFSVVSEVNTFNFYTGGSGTSSGGGQSGFGGKGGGF